MTYYVIYNKPRDFPNAIVVRRFQSVNLSWLGASNLLLADLACVLCSSLEEARFHIPADLVNVGREPEDEPQIIESWMPADAAKKWAEQKAAKSPSAN